MHIKSLEVTNFRAIRHASLTDLPTMIVSLDEPSGFRKQGPFTMPDGTEFYVKWEGTSHTPADIPVTAQGPWAYLLAGTYQNTFIYQVMYAALTGNPPPTP